MIILMYLFKMEYNLIQKYYDMQCQLFINGHIGWLVFTELEQEYYKKKHLFIINLN
ncbi:hypothetical protein HWC88_gp47 [Flavobacterium phage vB_FspS_hattifnatt9-1]|uniref:Uncharacterized protein n=2 Tax=Caudoviricetes TaxID=2731619 RepID=A0A6B9L9N7_9CAUD|nr:hypothetical protein HWC88_gp47 [Flavobacterium phage vB_FspS_hattifnatt9-1]QHB38732.1 hypothetical protein hattifnatt91_gp047 [Flavobacterium phage vB_FspS_hattifnatt9-1]QHB40329.1 hypothetical protein sniff92_gp045 [Flavobacterium phage vB_FspS_sniff9-2]